MRIFFVSIRYCSPASCAPGLARSVRFDEPSAVISLARVCKGGRPRLLRVP